MAKSLMKECTVCHNTYAPENFIKVSSPFFPDGQSPICTDCIERLIKKDGPNWKIVNRLCQWINIPFIPEEWEKMYKVSKERAFATYSQIRSKKEYQTVDWETLNKQYIELEKEGNLKSIMSAMTDAEKEVLRKKWGPNYSDEEIEYLEQLFRGILETQIVSSPLQIDQTIKLCKVSLYIDQKIRAGEDFQKMLKSYDDLLEAAQLTPQNMRNMSDFESVGELFAFLEKKGWVNKFYDGVTRDIVDQTMMNIQAANRRLYINENGISEEIEKRIEILKNAKELEEVYYDETSEDDLDMYDAEGMRGLEEFDPNV